jgi:AcrR family transcriptional regulator
MSATTASNPRQRIIDTALRLFYQQGYRATGINQIIAESEVAKATFYSHFPSKEALCVTYLQARHAIWMGWLKASCDQYPSPLGRLLGVFDFIREWMGRCEFRGCAFLNIASEIPALDSGIRAEVVRHKDSLKGYIGRLLDATVATGAAPLPDSERQGMVDMLYVLVEGAIVASQNYGHVWPVDAARQAASRLLGR